MKDRSSYVEFIEQTYFGSVADGNINQVLSCFNDDARVIIRHGDQPERLFALHPLEGEAELPSFYEHLCDNYDCWFGKYHHYIDIEQDSAASRFTVRLEPKPNGLYANAAPQELRNCNFFEFRSHRISDMIIYYSNPDEQSDDAHANNDKPTGYPKP
jgi:hypothetical protein